MKRVAHPGVSQRLDHLRNGKRADSPAAANTQYPFNPQSDEPCPICKGKGF